MRKYLTLPFVFFVLTNTSFAHDSQSPSSIAHYRLDRVSKHIYVVHGTQELPSLKIRGFMNNPAAVLTNNGVIIIDPGSSA
jgi:hypothetical protein